MSDQRALLAAICAHPDEDTPRLAYADWLDEHAGAMPRAKRESVRMRAELIRVQCELARMPPDEEDGEMAARRIELEDRQAVLTKNASRRRGWAKPLCQLPEGSPDIFPDSSTFFRGFPDFATGSAADLLALGETLFDISPLRYLWCRNIHGELGERFLAQPWLTRVRHLTTSTNHDNSGWVDAPTRHWAHRPGPTDAASTERLFAASTFANLESLVLQSWEFRTPGTAVLHRAMANLRRLHLHGGYRHASANYARVGELLPPATRIRDFTLAFTRYGAEELATLASLPQFGELERLTLGTRFSERYTATPLGVEGLRAITSSPLWKSLRSFHDDMGDSGLTAPEVEAFPTDPAPNLRTLVLHSGRIAPAISFLTANPLLSSVTTLKLNRTKLGDEGAKLLAQSPHLGRLVRLDLSWCGIGPKGIKAIAEAPWAANLVCLTLTGCPIRKDGISALIAPGNFPKLKRLDAGDAAKNVGQKNRLRSRYGESVRF